MRSRKVQSKAEGVVDSSWSNTSQFYCIIFIIMMVSNFVEYFFLNYEFMHSACLCSQFEIWGISGFFIFFPQKQRQQSSTVKISPIFSQQSSPGLRGGKRGLFLVVSVKIRACYLPLALFLYNSLRIQQSLMADSRQPPITCEFLLRVATVKMKIKFPCRMTLQFNKQTITRQAHSAEYNRFVFNQDIVLRGDQNTTFQIFAHLYTEKGTKYTSGVFKLFGAQLIKCQPRQKLIVPLSKCLDPDAFCEIICEQVIDTQKASSRNSRVTTSKVINSSEKPELQSPQTKKINSEKYLIGETRSEIGFGQFGGLYTMGSEENRVRETTKTQILKTFTKSPTSKFSNMKYMTMNSGNIMKNLSQFPVEQVGSQRPSFAETEVFREGYYKLKQKLKKESQLAKEEYHKRMLLEANQNNFKLQIMKLKLKTEQQQKQVIEKNQKIKIINNQLIDFQKKDIDIVYLKEENANLERKLKISEQNVHIYQQDTESIKKLMGERLKLSEENLAVVKNQLEFAKAKIEQQKYEFDSEIKAKDNIILTKNNDLKMRGDTIERQKKLIKQLEEQAEARMFDFEKSLINERTSLQLKIDQIKSKRSITQKQKDEVCRENKELKQQIQKLKDQISLLEYNKKILSQDNLILAQEIQQLKLTKQKHSQLQKEYKFLQEQFETIRKNLQVAVQNKEINITELATKFDQGKQRHQKIKAQYDQRYKSLLVKTQEMELTIETSKNSLQKNKRTIDFQAKEISGLRQQNTSLRDELKVAQRRIISLEGEYSTNSNSYERQNSNIKFLLDKHKEDKFSLQKQNDILRQKLEKCEEKLKQCQAHQRQSKAKQRHLQQRLEKQAHKFKESQTKYQMALKQNQNNIFELNNSIDSLEKEVRKNVKKINQYQLLTIKTKETHQFLKKDVKLREEKVSSLESQLKTKTQDLCEALEKNKMKQLSIHQKQHQISKLRQEIVQYSNKSIKQEKMIELLSSEGQKLKKNGTQLQNTIVQRQKNEERLRQEIKSVRDQHVLETNRSKKIQAEFDKFKDSINDIISIEFTRLLSLPSSQNFLQRNSQRLRESQMSNGKTQRSRVRQSLDASQIANTLSQKLQQTKNSLWKMVKLNKALKDQNQQLLKQSQTQSNRHQFDKLELHRDIQLLQDEMNNIISDKEVQNLNYDNTLFELNKQIKLKENIIMQMKFENEELNAINTGLKTDFQTNNELNDKKVNNLKMTINELNQKIEYLNFNLGCLEDKNHELQDKTNQQQSQIINQKQMMMKQEKTLLDTQESEQKLLKEIEVLKKEYKLLNEKYSEQQIMINSEKQTNFKYLLMIEEQQKKVQKLNQFIKSLIVQKQNAIKNQLQKSQEVNTLQAKNFELTHQIEVLQDQNQVHRKKIEEFKEEAKNLNKSLKQFEKNLTQEKTRHARSNEKIKERENDLEIKKEYIKDLQERYRELRDKNYKEIKELSNELEDKSAANLSQHKQLNDQILKLESQSKRSWQQNLVLKSELEHLTKQIYKKNDQIEDFQIEIKAIRYQKVNLQEQLASKQFLIHQKVDEIHRLEALFDSERINFNNLSSQYQAHEKQFNLNITQVTNEFNFKLETTQKEYEQKIQLNKRQLQYVKEKLRNTEEQLIKIQFEKKSQEIDFQQTKKNYEQKVKKIESEKLSTTLAKNNEIKKISEEGKLHFERFREKEAQLRKLNLELQQVKLRSERNQQFNTQSIQQGKTKEKLLQKEIDCYKKKQETNNNYKKKLLESLYRNEGNVRKTIANTMKKLTQICNKADSEKILGVVKGLQGGVVSAMMANLQAQ